MNIAFIGLGNMGGRMAHNLLKAGLTVYGYDLSEVANQHFAEAGGVVCDSPQAAAQQADVVITMLPAAKHVKEVYLGEEGVLEVLKAGALCIDSSTIDPQTIKDIAALAQSKNIHICDAPVSGGTIGAQAGTLTFMVGANDQTFEEVKPVLSHMGKHAMLMLLDENGAVPDMMAGYLNILQPTFTHPSQQLFTYAWFLGQSVPEETLDEFSNMIAVRNVREAVR